MLRRLPPKLYEGTLCDVVSFFDHAAFKGDMNVSHIKGYVFPGITFSLLKEGLVPRDKTLEQVQDQHTVNVKLGHASCWK